MRYLGAALWTQTFAAGSGAPASSRSASGSGKTSCSPPRAHSGTPPGTGSISSGHGLSPLLSGHAEMGLYRGSLRSCVLPVHKRLEGVGNRTTHPGQHRDIRGLQSSMRIRADIAGEYGFHVLVGYGLGSLDSRPASC